MDGNEGIGISFDGNQGILSKSLGKIYFQFFSIIVQIFNAGNYSID